MARNAPTKSRVALPWPQMVIVPLFHRHHILTEEDPARKSFLLATAAVVRRELIHVLDVMGIAAPPVM